MKKIGLVFFLLSIVICFNVYGFTKRVIDQGYFSGKHWEMIFDLDIGSGSNGLMVDGIMVIPCNNYHIDTLSIGRTIYFRVIKRENGYEKLYNIDGEQVLSIDYSIIEKVGNEGKLNDLYEFTKIIYDNDDYRRYLYDSNLNLLKSDYGYTTMEQIGGHNYFEIKYKTGNGYETELYTTDFELALPRYKYMWKDDFQNWHIEDCNGIVGRLDDNLNWIIPLSKNYSNIYDSSIAGGNYYKVEKDGYWGLLDSQGTVVIAPKYEELGVIKDTNFIKFKLNGFYGVMTVNGRVVKTIISTARRYTNISGYDSNKKIISYEMDGYKGECNHLGQQISKIRNEVRYNDAAIFDLKGNVKSCTIKENSSVTKLTFNRNGKLISSSPLYILTHDASGKVLSSKRGNRVTYYTYDSQGRVISEKDKDGDISTFEYNSEGQITERKSESIDFTYRIQSIDSCGNWIIKKSSTYYKTDNLLLDIFINFDLENNDDSVISRTIEYYSTTSSTSSTPSTTNKPSTTTTTKASYTPSKQTFTVNGVSFTMVRVEGGTFTMGATSEQGSDAEDSEKPAHQVTLSTYYIGETEVTQELWEAVMGSNPSYFRGAKRPVEQVSWDDCQEFIKKLNEKTGETFRLPTEAEWEYASRGGGKSKGYKYSGSNDLDAVAWYQDNSGLVSHNVATKQSNELGLYDMSGNVRECCLDWYGKKYYSKSPQTNPKGANSGEYHAARGGSWGISASCCRSSYRDYGTPDYRSYYVGLRLVLSESYTNKPDNKTDKKDNNELDYRDGFWATL